MVNEVRLKNGTVCTPEKWIKPLQMAKRIIDDCACANQESCVLCPMNAECGNELKDMGYAL